MKYTLTALENDTLIPVEEFIGWLHLLRGIAKMFIAYNDLFTGFQAEVALIAFIETGLGLFAIYAAGNNTLGLRISAMFGSTVVIFSMMWMTLAHDPDIGRHLLLFSMYLAMMFFSTASMYRNAVIAERQKKMFEVAERIVKASKGSDG
jgi:hypothetical protein